MGGGVQSGAPRLTSDVRRKPRSTWCPPPPPLFIALPLLVSIDVSSQSAFFSHRRCHSAYSLTHLRRPQMRLAILCTTLTLSFFALTAVMAQSDASNPCLVACLSVPGETCEWDTHPALAGGTVNLARTPDKTLLIKEVKHLNHRVQFEASLDQKGNLYMATRGFPHRMQSNRLHDPSAVVYVFRFNMVQNHPIYYWLHANDECQGMGKTFYDRLTSIEIIRVR